MNYALQNVSSGLIHEAQVGKQESIDRLAEVARERLFAYIYRLTLDHNLTQDLLQETILTMIQSLNQLEHVDQFWHWLFRTALGKVQHHYREQKRRTAQNMSEYERQRISRQSSSELGDGLTEMLRKELSDAVFTAMKRLKLKYRNVLVLRCFEDLSYAEIAGVMECSELQTRVLFFRAKHSLKRELAVRGFGTRYLLVGLALFGLVTTSAKASAASSTVTAASLEAGFAAGLIGTVASKVGIAAAAGLAAVAFAVPMETVFYALTVGFFGGLCIVLICLTRIYSS